MLKMYLVIVVQKIALSAYFVSVSYLLRLLIKMTHVKKSFPLSFDYLSIEVFSIIIITIIIINHFSTTGLLRCDH